MSKTFDTALENIATSEKLVTSNLYNLSKMDKSGLASFRERWPTIDTPRRRDILQELIYISEANFEVDFDPVFLIALGDEDALARGLAINGLWENQDVTLVAPLLHLLKTDEVVEVRAAAASALGKYIYLNEVEELSDQYVAPVKAALLETIYQPAEDIDVRRRAIEAMAFSSSDNMPAIIESAYYDSDIRMQTSALFAMGRSADPRWREWVINELDNVHTEIRFEAARACGELEASDAVGKLIMLIEEDSDSEVQEVSIWALGRIGGNAAREVLEAYSESQDEALALAADEALEELNLFGGDLDMFDFDEDDIDAFFDDVGELDEEDGELERH